MYRLIYNCSSGIKKQRFFPQTFVQGIKTLISHKTLPPANRSENEGISFFSSSAVTSGITAAFGVWHRSVPVPGGEQRVLVSTICCRNPLPCALRPQTRPSSSPPPQHRCPLIGCCLAPRTVHRDQAGWRNGWKRRSDGSAPPDPESKNKNKKKLESLCDTSIKTALTSFTAAQTDWSSSYNIPPTHSHHVSK